MNRQKLILTLLLVAFAGSLVYSYLRSPKQVEAPARPAAGRAQASKSKSAAPAKPRDEGGVHLALLDQERTRYGGSRRNIFSPIFRDELKPPPFKPLPPPPKPQPKPLPLPPPPAQAPPPAQPAPTPPPEQLMENAIGKVTFLGFLKKNGEKTVFLSNNNEIILAKVGTTLGGGNYVVSELTDEAMTIKPVAGGREVVIPLEESRGLTKRRPSKWTTPP